MRLLRVLLARVAGLFASRERDNDVRAEFESHLEMHAAESMRRGRSADDARRDARLAAGGLSVALEDVRERRGLPWLEGLVTDVRYAIRALRARPAFALAVIATLTLGIGANTAMFSIVNAVVLRPLPYPGSDHIVAISQIYEGRDQGVVDDMTVGELSRSAPSLVAAAAYRGTSVTVQSIDGPLAIDGLLVGPGYFDVFGVRPALGRVFSASEAAPGGPAVAVVSDQMWRGRLGGDSAVVGKTVVLDNLATTVVGVMPPSFTTARRAQWWQPLRLRPAGQPGVTLYFSVVARVREGATMAAVRTELTAIEAAVALRRRGSQARAATPVVMTLHERRYGDTRKPLLLLFATVGVLLFVACANVANLSLARSERRRREFGLRLALGARRGRLVRFVLCESLLLSLTGGALGLLVSRIAVRYFVHISPGVVGTLDAVRADGWVLGFTLLAAAVTGVTFGLLPAIAATRTDVRELLSSAAPQTAGGRRQQTVRSVLVVLELATALVLLTGAGLLTRTLLRVTSIDPGFRPDHLIVAHVRLPRARYADDATRIAFFERALAEIRRRPTVRAASLAGVAPPMGREGSLTTTINGVETPRIDFATIDASYFATLGARVVEGRAISEEDRAGTTPVMVVNVALAKVLSPGASAVGKSFVLDGPHTIVGVVEDIVHLGLESPRAPTLYRAVAQEGLGYSVSIIVRTTDDPRQMQAPILQILRDMDAALPPAEITTMDQALADQAAPRRFPAILLGVFAALAGLIAVIGLYALLSYLVAERTREIGIRVALGADARRVTRLIVGQGLVLTLLGVGLGVVGAAAMVRLLRGMLYEMSVYDPWSFGATAGLLVVVAVVASYVPARRASRIDAVIALRAE